MDTKNLRLKVSIFPRGRSFFRQCQYRGILKRRHRNTSASSGENGRRKHCLQLIWESRRHSEDEIPSSVLHIPWKNPPFVNDTLNLGKTSIATRRLRLSKSRGLGKVASAPLSSWMSPAVCTEQQPDVFQGCVSATAVIPTRPRGIRCVT